jgi:hypothetical protein
MICDDSGGALEEGHFDAPERLGKEAILSLLAYRTSTRETTRMMPVSMVFRRKQCLPCDLLFGAPQITQPMTDVFDGHLRIAV